MDRATHIPETGGPDGLARELARDLARARRVKAKYEALLLLDANVISVGIGLSPAPAGAGEVRTPTLVICVRQALSAAIAAGGSLIPDQIEGVPVTVQVTGGVRAQ